MTTLRNKVEARLLKCNSEKAVAEMMAKHYEYAIRKYTTLKTICECIVTLD
ncbi:hypothetical protein HZQ94_14725 [Elizabethkingia anophelis]|uniref:hypothetical protein n=1 Tax=Elizabethkingia TaxID=308865 RepID=UPI0015C5106E|nr:hypothetical protein [Elizabethkingia miricola]MCT3674439.1 hypothetical protein [Elizabethkingia anophelis]MCT3682080.1 hypothetical protein [Elizabethkingia anophelis]